jgi:DUF4097 and DUF4098 domain-containing protein YvlB
LLIDETTPPAATERPVAAMNEPVFIKPTMNIIFEPQLDENGNPYPTQLPQANAMPYEEAANIGAEYIFEMTGERIDGKTVDMQYAVWPHSSRTYWIGNVFETQEDQLLYTFTIDAVTGEWVDIVATKALTRDISNPGEGKTVTVTPQQIEDMQYQEPPDVAEYKEIARTYAEKHFKHSAVVSVEFSFIGVNMKDGEYTVACKIGKDIPYPFTIYDKGRQIEFKVTDNTGQVALIMIDMDTKAVYSIDSGKEHTPDSEKANTPLVNTKSYPLAGITDINISYLADSITIKESTNDQIEIREYMAEDNKSYSANVAQNGSAMTINSGNRPENYGFPGEPAFPCSLEVLLPKSYHGNLSIGSVNAHVSSNVDFSLNTLDISSTLGNIDINKISAENIKLHSTSGTITVDQAVGNMDISTTAEDITVSMPESMAFNFEATSTSGAIITDFDYEITNQINDRVTVGATVGQNPAYAVKITSTAGDIEVDAK